jgi:hypothetical protein
MHPHIVRNSSIGRVPAYNAGNLGSITTSLFFVFAFIYFLPSLTLKNKSAVDFLMRKIENTPIFNNSNALYIIRTARNTDSDDRLLGLLIVFVIYATKQKFVTPQTRIMHFLLQPKMQLDL